MGTCCGDCACKEGKLHNFFPSCDMERCPLCKGQLLSCDCDKSKITQEIREPYFESCFNCARCGKKYPDMKMVSDEEWKYICGSSYKLDEILCPKCMDFIKLKRDKLKC